MKLRNHNTYNAVKCKVCEMNFFDIPVECIRKTRSLNIDPRYLAASEEVYKILRSANGKKLYA